jgi:hypothetical protein
MQTTQNETLARLEKFVARLATENAQLRAENRRLRKLKVNAGRGRILARALDDATVMLTWRFAGYSISRAKCAELGLTDRPWEWARALLMAARIHDGADITETDFDVALRKLAAAYDRIEAQEDIGALVLRRRKREPMTAPKAEPKPGTKAAQLATK